MSEHWIPWEEAVELIQQQWGLNRYDAKMALGKAALFGRVAKRPRRDSTSFWATHKDFEYSYEDLIDWMDGGGAGLLPPRTAAAPPDEPTVPQEEEHAPTAKPFTEKTAKAFVNDALDADPNLRLDDLREAAKGRGRRDLIDEEYRRQKLERTGAPLKRGPRTRNNSAK